MENKKYKKGDDIRLYKKASAGRWTTYTDALDKEERSLLAAAAAKGLVLRCNDSPRGGKWGEHYKVLKYFTANSLGKKLAAEKKAIDKEIAKIPRTECVRSFTATSKMGSIKIDGVYYAIFRFDCEAAVEVCKIDTDAFRDAKLITRRQVFNKRAPLTIVKFDTPKPIEIALCDCDDSFGSEKIANAIGFCIWAHKAKIFVPNK